MGEADHKSWPGSAYGVCFDVRLCLVGTVFIKCDFLHRKYLIMVRWIIKQSVYRHLITFYIKKLWSYSCSETVLKTMAILRGQEGPITSCTFNPDVSQLATASRDAVRFLILSLFITSDYGFMHLFILFVNWDDIYRNVALCYGTSSPVKDFWSASLLTQTFYVEWIRNRCLGKMDMTLRKEFY